MPILSYFNNMWYGSASGAMVEEAIASSQIDIKGYATPDLDIVITQPIPYLKPTRLVNSPLIIQGTGTVERALPKGRAKIALDVRVNQISQDDVTGAVLEAQIEGGLTFKQAVRLILSVLAGKTTITPGEGGTATVKFRDINDTKDRLTATMSGSERSNVSLNPS